MATENTAEKKEETKAEKKEQTPEEKKFWSKAVEEKLVKKGHWACFGFDVDFRSGWSSVGSVGLKLGGVAAAVFGIVKLYQHLFGNKS